MKKILWLFLLMPALQGCTKTFAVARPEPPKIHERLFAANPNDLYYALRWALPANGYPIAEEDFQNGVIKSRYVPVGARSHYIAVFGRRDYGVSGAYHQLEARLIPQGGMTLLQIGSRTQAVVKQLKSSGREEEKILKQVGDYIRSPAVQLTNQGLKG